MGNKYSEQGIQREEEKSIRELKEKKRRGELGVIAARNAKRIYSRGDQEVRAENTKRRGKQEVRAAGSTTIKYSSVEQEVRAAENTKKRRVEGNKKSKQGKQIED